MVVASVYRMDRNFNIMDSWPWILFMDRPQDIEHINGDRFFTQSEVGATDGQLFLVAIQKTKPVLLKTILSTVIGGTTPGGVTFDDKNLLHGFTTNIDTRQSLRLRDWNANLIDRYDAPATENRGMMFDNFSTFVATTDGTGSLKQCLRRRSIVLLARTLALAGFTEPTGVCSDGKNLYSVRNDNTVGMHDRNGNLIKSYTLSGGTPALSGITFDGKNFYAVDNTS